MRRYSNVQALLFSFFSPDVYRDAARQWRGAGLLYVLLLALIVVVAATLRIQFAVSSFASGTAPKLIAQLPTITIDHGRVAIDQPSPVLIRDPKSGSVVAIIDTTATVTGLEGSEAHVLVTRDHVVFRKSAAETRMFELSRVQHFVLSRDVATRWVKLAQTWLAVVLAPFILVGIYLARIFQQLLATLATFVVTSVRGVRLDFAATMRVAAVAMTPATLVFDAVGFFDVHLPGTNFLWYVVTIGYAVFGVNACRAEPAAPAAASAAPGTAAP